MVSSSEGSSEAKEISSACFRPRCDCLRATRSQLGDASTRLIRQDCRGFLWGVCFGLATGHRFDLNETFRVVKRLTGYRGGAAYGPERAGDVKHSVADISQAEKHLGYRPKVDFEEGLRRTVAWYRGPSNSEKGLVRDG